MKGTKGVCAKSGILTTGNISDLSTLQTNMAENWFWQYNVL